MYLGKGLVWVMVLWRKVTSVMKIVSFNVRGLGGRVKKRELKKLVNKEKLDMICIQETQFEYITQRVCNSLWGGDDFEWSFFAFSW